MSDDLKKEKLSLPRIEIAAQSPKHYEDWWNKKQSQISISPLPPREKKPQRLPPIAGLKMSNRIKEIATKQKMGDLASQRDEIYRLLRAGVLPNSFFDDVCCGRNLLPQNSWDRLMKYSKYRHAFAKPKPGYCTKSDMFPFCAPPWEKRIQDVSLRHDRQLETVSDKTRRQQQRQAEKVTLSRLDAEERKLARALDQMEKREARRMSVKKHKL